LGRSLCYGARVNQESEPTRVLLIEDDPEFAEMYRLRLEADEYLVEWARDGEEGLAMARTWSPDLIFLDIRMPKKDGLEVLQELRSDPATQDLPVVVLSNYSDEELMSRGRQFGILDWKTKIDTTPGGMSQWVERWSQALAAERQQADQEPAADTP
jgi:CheY-like chemotaxis protein